MRSFTSQAPVCSCLSSRPSESEKPNEDASVYTVEQFIRAKYERMVWSSDNPANKKKSKVAQKSKKPVDSDRYGVGELCCSKCLSVALLLV